MSDRKKKKTMAEGRPPVMVASHLQTQLSRFPSSLLDRPCLESHLGKLVRLLSSETVMLMAADLGLAGVDVDDVRDSLPWKPAAQRLEMLKRSQATYRYV